MSLPCFVSLIALCAVSAVAEEAGARYRLETHAVPVTRIGALWDSTRTDEALFKVDTALGSVWRFGTNAFERVEVRDLVTQKGFADWKQAQVLKRLDAIIIPELVFRDVHVTNAIASLQEQVRSLDPSIARDPDNEVRITYRGPANPGALCRIEARRISAKDALKLIADFSGLTYRVADDAIVLVPNCCEEGEVITRLYRLDPSFRKRMAGSTVSNVLTQIGFTVNAWTELKFSPELDLLRVSETHRGHWLLEALFYETGMARLEPGRFSLVSKSVVGKATLYLLDGDTAATWCYQSTLSRTGKRREFFMRLADTWADDSDPTMFIKDDPDKDLMRPGDTSSDDPIASQ